MGITGEKRGEQNGIRTSVRIALEFLYACVTLGWLLAIVAYKIRRKWGIMYLHNHLGVLYDLWTRFMPLYKKVGISTAEVAARSHPIRTLDIATGTGFVLLLLAKSSQASCGVDISFEILRIAKSKARKANLDNIQCVNGDVENLCFMDEMFDAITCNFGIFYFPNQVKAIREMCRVLKPGGELVFSTYGEIGSYFLSGQFHSADEWTNIIHNAGLSLVEAQHHTWLYLVLVARKVT